MYTLPINIKSTAKLAYPIYIGNDIFGKIFSLFNLSQYSKIVIITDKAVDKILSQKLQQQLKIKSFVLVIDSGEKAKNIQTLQQIWHELLKIGCDRKSLVINLGGGVITDMGGFAASTFMRGVDFLQIPTTLLSMVDASVGGKVGIDFADVKNLLGSFNQPIGVIIDINTLKSLPKREFNSGFAEIIKHGLISDKDYFDFVTSKKPDEFLPQELEEIIYKSCQIKSTVVSQDEKENGLRKILNFGHTIGHAIESLSLKTDKPLLHGEAVSIGMVAEAKISQLIGNISESDFQQIKKVLGDSGLPIKTDISGIDHIMEKITHDKKSEKGQVNWTLLKKIGEGVINQQVSSEIVVEALGVIS